MTTEGAEMTAAQTFHIAEIAADGEEFPVPSAVPLKTVAATNAVEALRIFKDDYERVTYTAQEDIVAIPDLEIMAYTDEAMRREGLFV